MRSTEDKKMKRKSMQISGENRESEISHGKKGRKSETEKILSQKLESMNKNRDSYIKVRKLASISQPGKGEDGLQKTNQDSYLVMQKINNSEYFNLFSVMDGHGLYGHLVSQFVTKYVNQKLNNHKKLKGITNEEEIYYILKKNNWEIIRHLFTHSDKELRNGGEIDANFSGSTDVMIVQIGNHLIVANVGDSRAIMCTSEGLVVLSKDQKPDDEEERKRIEKAGGEISQYEEDGEKSGPFRVWQPGQVYPGIAMSRSIGDFIATSLGVISEPVITEMTISKDTKFIVVCSDGVWEFLDNNKVVDMVLPFYEKNDPDGAAKLLIKESTKWWEKEDVVVDDITVIVVFFN